MSCAVAADIRARVVALELALLVPETRRDPQFLDRHLSEDFEEIAASGRRFGKQEVLARLPLETGIAFQAEEFQCRLLAVNVVLLNYDAQRSVDGLIVASRRTSIWRMERDVWRMCFHQGTLLATD